MGKIKIAALAAAVVFGNLNAYELALSPYTPADAAMNNFRLNDYDKPEKMKDLYDVLNRIAKEMEPASYSKNYLDPTFVAGMADAFDRDGAASIKKVEREKFSKRSLEAVLNFHSRTLVPVEGMSRDGYEKRSGDMIDFIVMPILAKNDHLLKEKMTLNEFSTTLRKQAIDAAKGRVWAAGRAFSTVWVQDYRFGYGSNGKANSNPIRLPAKIKGVQYNSFASELLTIFQAARAADVEMEVLAQAEKLPSMSDKEIQEAVERFNQTTTGTSGRDYESGQCYGFLAEGNLPFLMEFFTLADKDALKAKEFLDIGGKQLGDERLLSGSSRIWLNKLYQSGKVYTIEEYKHTDSKKCLEQSIQSFSPEKYKQFVEKSNDGTNRFKDMIGGKEKESVAESILFAPLRFLGGAISECQKQGRCSGR